MSPWTPLALLLVLLTGCARLQAIVTPATTPAPAAEVPPPPPHPAPPHARPVAKPPAPVLPSRTVVTPPPPLPAPPPAPPTPVAPATQPPAAPTPLPPLTAQMPPEEERKLVEDTTKQIGETERILRQLEAKPMSPPQQDMLTTAQNLLDQARKAMTSRDLERAANLATKSRALGDDLARTVK